MKPEGKVLGNEFNIFTRYQAFKQLQLVFLFGYFIPEDVMLINESPARNAFILSFQCLFTLQENK